MAPSLPWSASAQNWRTRLGGRSKSFGTRIRTYNSFSNSSNSIMPLLSRSKESNWLLYFSTMVMGRPCFLAIIRISRCSSESSTFSLKPCLENQMANSEKVSVWFMFWSASTKQLLRSPSGNSSGSSTLVSLQRIFAKVSEVSCPSSNGSKSSSLFVLRRLRTTFSACSVKTSYACLMMSSGIRSSIASLFMRPTGFTGFPSPMSKSGDVPPHGDGEPWPESEMRGQGVLPVLRGVSITFLA
mmetsp:Transcript_45611/g.145545  ORF Transcript_45611/g.145545 Transcript_45611/m.145545 type:complete len:242 (+) Transcript_45611:216-941(+)